MNHDQFQAELIAELSKYSRPSKKQIRAIVRQIRERLAKQKPPKAPAPKPEPKAAPIEKTEWKYTCRKVPFTEEIADIRLREIARREANSKRTIPIRKYLCQDCGLWHLTSKPRRKRINHGKDNTNNHAHLLAPQPSR